MKDYTDIIDLPPFHAPDKPYMPIGKRAAIFAAYRALGDIFKEPE